MTNKVHAGFANDGRPIGLELLGRTFTGAKLLGYACGQATHHRRAPAPYKLATPSWQNATTYRTTKESTGPVIAEPKPSPAPTARS